MKGIVDKLSVYIAFSAEYKKKKKKKLNILLMRSNSNLLLNRCPVIRDVLDDTEQ